MNRRQFLYGIAAATGTGMAAAQAGSKIRSIDIVHHTHLDVGYTALPSAVRADQVRYLDSAIDCCNADPAFRWTVETLVELDDWWHASTPARHAELERLVRAGRMDVMALPFNQTPFLNAMQWREMLRWIPAAQWKSLQIRAAMQNDVNGFPRAGTMQLLDHGIRHLLMGINADSGGPPFRRPDAFWWKMPDGRRIFVWLGEHYGSVMNYLAPARDLKAYKTDETSLRAAQTKLTEHLRTIEAEGYAFDRLILTHTHPQKYDNGSPYPSLAPFVVAWNKLGLTPALRFTTATEAVFAMEREVGASLPELTGEWTDWWANGDASGPREVSASRVAKRALAAAVSPVFGAMPEADNAAVTASLRDLCLFDEHTWGADSSVSAPASLRTLGQYVEKSELAYRPMGLSTSLLDRRVKSILTSRPTGTYAINASTAEVSGWVGKQWVEKLPANSARLLTGDSAVEASKGPKVVQDSNAWPVSAIWPGMPRPLFDGALGDFLAVGVVPPANRRTITQLHAKFDAQLRDRSFAQSGASYSPAKPEETPHSLRFTQEIRHPRLGASTRTVELWRREPRARVTVSFDRLSSTAPEVLFLSFSLPSGLALPRLSCGGVPFTPYRDHLRGACRDYVAVDGWADFSDASGHWLWATRDAPLVAFGGPHVVERHQDEPKEPNRIFARVFDNCWHTNFVADSHGVMEFQFDLAWRASLERPADLAEALAGDLISASA